MVALPSARTSKLRRTGNNGEPGAFAYGQPASMGGPGGAGSSGQTPAGGRGGGATQTGQPGGPGGGGLVIVYAW